VFTELVAANGDLARHGQRQEHTRVLQAGLQRAGSPGKEAPIPPAPRLPMEAQTSSCAPCRDNLNARLEVVTSCVSGRACCRSWAWTCFFRSANERVGEKIVHYICGLVVRCGRCEPQRLQAAGCRGTGEK